MALASGLPEYVGDAEEIVRFLTSSNHFNSAHVKPSAFAPTSSGKKSVFRRDGAELATLWQWATAFLPETKVYGAALLFAAQVRAADLAVVASEPPPRHADIVGWDISEPGSAMRKASTMQKQQLLASASRRVIVAEIEGRL